jgi:hypothetical protein
LHRAFAPSKTANWKTAKAAISAWWKHWGRSGVHEEGAGMILDVLTFIVSVSALAAAIHIPRQIMRNQMYADLVKEYRSTEMGAAVLAIFCFFKKDCRQNMETVCEKYEELYERQIKKPLEEGKPVHFSQTLHFQRRLVSQFYADMAFLHFERRLTKKQMEYWFTPNETKLLSILLHMVKPAQKVFEQVDSIPDPPESGAPMNELLFRLYEEVKDEG